MRQINILALHMTRMGDQIQKLRDQNQSTQMEQSVTQLQQLSKPAREQIVQQPQNAEMSKPATQEQIVQQPQKAELPKPAAQEQTVQQPQKAELPKPATQEQIVQQPQKAEVPKPAAQEQIVRQPQKAEVPKPAAQERIETESMQAQPHLQQPRHTTQPSLSTQQPWKPQSQPWKPHPQEKSLRELLSDDAETAIGKKLMGVVASILIFISLILFATVLIPLLGENAKFILLCLVSALFTAFGLYKLSKDDKNTLYQSITGCGVGAIYITLFLSNVYFHLTNDVGLYFLLLIWAIGVLYLSKKRSKVFQVIGNIGILISVFFGTYLCVTENDAGKMTILIGYFIVGSLAFFLCHVEDSKASVVNQVFQLLSACILTLGLNLLTGGGLRYVGAVLLAVFMIAMFVRELVCMRADNLDESGILGIFFSGQLLFLDMVTLERGGVAEAVALLMVAVILAAVEWKIYRLKLDPDKCDIVTVWTLLLALVGGGMTFGVPGISDMVGFALLAIPFVCYGFVRKRQAYQVMGMVGGYLILLNYNIPIPMQAFWLVLFLGVVGFLMYRKEGRYRLEYKMTWYVLGLCSILMLCYRLLSEQLPAYDTFLKLAGFLLICVFHICMSKTRLGRNWITGEKERGMGEFCYAINGFLMLYNLAMISSVDGQVIHVVYILTALALFTVNVGSQFAMKETYMDLYVVIKYTVLLLVIIQSYDAADYMMSIMLFVFAIVSIVAGFRIRIKTLRVYGLVLSLFCVVKLIMVDITYDNTLGRALSFFISGVLCFAISALYYHVERKTDSSKQHLQEGNLAKIEHDGDEGE